jgi:hypothetical protein
MSGNYQGYAMHKLANYELIVSRQTDPDAAEDQEGPEVLLLTVERSDIPEILGSPFAVRWVQADGLPALEIAFGAPGGVDHTVQLTHMPSHLADTLFAFEDLLLVWMDEGSILGEVDLAFTPA